MYDNFRRVLVKRIRSKDKCYCVGVTLSLMCNRVILRVEELQHQSLGHVNYKFLNKISSLKTVKGLHLISMISDHIYGSF